MGKKKLNRLGKGVPDIAFRFGAKKKNKQTNKKTFRGNQQSCWSKNLDQSLLCSPQHKIFGDKFLRP